MPEALNGRRPQRRKHVHRRVPSTSLRRRSVAVVIAAYNYGRYLAECVGSALTQRDVDVEIVIIDDGSTDDTPSVTVGLALDPRVTVIRNDPNLGQIPAVNLALERIGSEFVVKLDADDLLTPGSLARSTALLEAHPQVGFVYGRPRHFTGPTPTAKDARARSWTIWPGPEWVADRCRSGFNVISQPEVVMRTELVRKAGRLRADLPHTFDMYLWMQLASLSDVGRVNGPAQGLYRVHDASLQRTVHSGFLLDIEGRRDAFEAVFAADAGNLAGAAELLRTARRALAASAFDRVCRAYDRGRVAQEPVEELISFGVGISPRPQSLREWSALERRRSIGADRASRHPRFFADAVARRALEEFARWRWLRTGEL